MSKLLTAVLLLYIVCIHRAAPAVKPVHCATDKGIKSATTNGRTSEHEENIQSNAASTDRYQCDTQALGEGRSTFPKSTILDHHDLTETLNTTSSNPKVLVRNKRMTVDTYGSAKEGWFIMKSRSVELPCFTTGRKSPKWPEYTKFKWLDVNKKAVANSRYKNNHDGWLNIKETELSDTGIFQCSVIGKDKTVKKTVSVPLKVFILPTFSLQIKLHYDPKSCTVNEKKQQRDKVRGFLCEKTAKCQYKITSKCKTASTQSGQVLGKSKNEQVVTAVKYMPSTFVPPHCKPKCMIKAIKKHLDQDKTSAFKKIPIGRKPSKQKFFIKKQCAAGFTIYKEIVCLPCRNGTYSNAGDDACTQCARGQYQSAIGMSKCHKCPKGRYTVVKGAASLSLCKVPHSYDLVMSLTVNTLSIEHYAAIGAVPVIIILLIIICSCCCSKRSKKKTKKKEKLLQDDEEHKHTKIGFESDVGASTEMETDFKTTEQSSSGSEGEGNKSEESVSKGHGRSSNKSGKKRNVNNSHWIHTTNSSIMLEKFTCSEPLVDTSTPNLNFHNAMQYASTTPKEFPQTDAPFIRCADGGSYQRHVETNTLPERAGKTLASRFSVVDLSNSPFEKPENSSTSCTTQVSSGESNVFSNNSLLDLSCDDVEVANVCDSSSKTNYSLTPTSTTLDVGQSEKTACSKDPNESMKTFQVPALPKVPVSVRIATYPGMATYNNPACMPKPITISRYSEAALKDLFPVSPQHTCSQITPEFLNMTTLNHRKSEMSAHTDPETYASGYQMTLGSQTDSGFVSSKQTDKVQNPSSAILCPQKADQDYETIDTQSSGYSISSAPRIPSASNMKLQSGIISFEQSAVHNSSQSNQHSSQTNGLFNDHQNQRTFPKDFNIYKARAPNATTIPLPPGSFNYLLPRSQSIIPTPPLFTEQTSATSTYSSHSPAIISTEKASDDPTGSAVSTTELRKMMTQRYGIPLPNPLKPECDDTQTDTHARHPTPPPLPSSPLGISLEPTQTTNRHSGALTQEPSESLDKENASNRTDKERTYIVSNTLQKLMLTMPQVGEAKITGPSCNLSNGKETALIMSSNSGDSQ